VNLSHVNPARNIKLKGLNILLIYIFRSGFGCAFVFVAFLDFLKDKVQLGRKSLEAVIG
jgi:hypothetical protein